MTSPPQTPPRSFQLYTHPTLHYCLFSQNREKTNRRHTHAHTQSKQQNKLKNMKKRKLIRQKVAEC